MRTQMCGKVRLADEGKEIVLCGWVAKRRDHGGLIFFDVRDRSGFVQVVFDPKVLNETSFETAASCRNEYVVRIAGKVRARPEGMRNSKILTGDIEILAQACELLSPAETPPFATDEDAEVSENLRLKYRYLDLRRPSLQGNLMRRHQMIRTIRSVLDRHDFCEIETPILYKSTPEGARDFIVPSRMSPGQFYALPQSPQTLKQLLMIGGMDRYYQIARCFRDEDLRADRQPEFTQVDIEASFLPKENLFVIIEDVLKTLWKEVLGLEVKTPFLRMSYREAMDRFGSDKPDTRFGLELIALSDVFKKSEFQVFKSALTVNVVGQPGAIRGLVVKGASDQFSRGEVDKLQEELKAFGAKGLLSIKVQEGGQIVSPAAKFISDSERAELLSHTKALPGDQIFIVADAKAKVVYDSLGALRLILGKKLKLIPEPSAKVFNFLWVIDFPLMEFDEKEGRYYAAHHPFTSPIADHVQKLRENKDLVNIVADAYDIVLNGMEIGGGSQRIFTTDLQDSMFRALGISKEEAQEKFGFFLEALSYGTPPHGGIALGVDRLAALLSGAQAIREVIAFPKTASGSCLMSETPSGVSPEQLRELSIRTVMPQKS